MDGFFVPAEGFKPPTLGAEIRCAIQLRHAGFLILQKYCIVWIKTNFYVIFWLIDVRCRIACTDYCRYPMSDVRCSMSSVGCRKSDVALGTLSLCIFNLPLSAYLLSLIRRTIYALSTISLGTFNFQLSTNINQHYLQKMNFSHSISNFLPNPFLFCVFLWTISDSNLHRYLFFEKPEFLLFLF